MKHEDAIFDSQCRDVMETLEDGDWHKGPDIKVKCGVAERTIRHIAEVTASLISGNEGYKRLDKATPGEVDRHVNSLQSRAKKILDRVDGIQRARSMRSK